MEQSPSWKAKSFSAGQEIHRILLKPKVHYHVHKNPALPLSYARWIQFMATSCFF
jgi:hypothetical protein